MEGNEGGNDHAGHVFLLMGKKYRISRSIRGQWFFQHIKSLVCALSNEELITSKEELEILSVIPENPYLQSQQETPTCCLVPSTNITFIGREYKFVFCLDISPSAATVDVESGKVLLEEIYDNFRNCLTGLVQAFRVPGSNLLLKPDLTITVLAHVPIATRTCQVLVQGHSLTEECLTDLLVIVRSKLSDVENSLANFIADYIFTEKSGLPSDAKKQDALLSPEASLFMMFRDCLLALQLLPDNASAGLVIVTDGAFGLSDANAVDAVLAQMRASTVVCSFLLAGKSPPHFTMRYGYVAQFALMQFIATATSGAYLTCCPEVKQIDRAEARKKGVIGQPEMNIYHRALYCWSFQRDVDKDKILTNFNETDPDNAMAYHHRNPVGFSASLVRVPQLLHITHTIKIFETNLQTRIASVLSVRLREGYSIDRVSIPKDVAQLDVKLILPWKEHVFVEYWAKAAWPLDHNRKQTHVEMYVGGLYEFLNDLRSKSKTFGYYRKTVIKKFELFVKSLQNTDELLVRLQSFSSNPLFYRIPESAKNGVPLFYLPPNSATPVLSLQVGRSRKSHHKSEESQFAVFWKPVLSLDPKTWQRWFHSHRVSVLLENDRPIQSSLFLSSSNGRFASVHCRVAMSALNVMLKEWSSFVLLENHSYIRFLSRSGEDHPYSFCLLRLQFKGLSIVIRVAFLGGTAGSERHKVVSLLKESLGQLTVTNNKPLFSADFSPPDSPVKMLSTRKDNLKCVVFLKKPLERILIKYDAIPDDLMNDDNSEGSGSHYLASTLGSPDRNQESSSNQASSYVSHTRLTTLSLALYSQRWIWKMSYGGSSSLSKVAVAKILLALTKRRLQEGFHFGSSSGGVVTLVKELQMQSGRDDPGKVSPCVVQFVLFPPHHNSGGSRHGMGDDMTESDGYAEACDLQMVTEMWIEPQFGYVTAEHDRMGYIEAMKYDQIAKAVFTVDKVLIQEMATYACVESLCRERLMSPEMSPNDFDVKTLYTNDPIVRIPFLYDLMSLLKRSNLATMCYPLLRIDEDQVKETPSQDSLPNDILVNLFHGSMLQMHTYHLPLSDASDTVSQFLSHSCTAEMQGCGLLSKRDNDATGECENVQWSGFSKKTDSRLLLTFVPHSMDDVDNIFSNQQVPQEVPLCCTAPVLPVLVFECCTTSVGELPKEEIGSIIQDYTTAFLDIDVDIAHAETKHSKLCDDFKDGEVLREHCHTVYERYFRAFVSGVFENLQRGHALDKRDVDSSIEMICEESCMQINVTDFTQILCNHMRHTMGDEDVFLVQKISDVTGEGMTTRASGSSTSSVAKVSMALRVKCGREEIHDIVQERFRHIMGRSFRAIANHEHMFFYVSPHSALNVESGSYESDDGDELHDFSEADFQGRSKHDDFDEDANLSELSQKSVKGSTIYDVDDQSSESVEMMSDQDSMSMTSDNVPIPVDDVVPLFIHLTCTVKYRTDEGTAISTCSVDSLPTCIADIFSKLSDVEQQQSLPESFSSVLSISLDLNCLTLPQDSESEDRGGQLKSPLQKLSSERYYSDMADVVTGGTEATHDNQQPGRVMTEQESLIDDSPRSPVVLLPKVQQAAIHETSTAIDWLLKDEIASSLRSVQPITAEVLARVEDHINASVTRCSTGNQKKTELPLKFVFGFEKSIEFFLNELSVASLTGYVLIPEGSYYYVVKDTTAMTQSESADQSPRTIQTPKSIPSPKTVSNVVTPSVQSEHLSMLSSGSESVQGKDHQFLDFSTTPLADVEPSSSTGDTVDGSCDGESPWWLPHNAATNLATDDSTCFVGDGDSEFTEEPKDSADPPSRQEHANSDNDHAVSDEVDHNALIKSDKLLASDIVPCGDSPSIQILSRDGSQEEEQERGDISSQEQERGDISSQEQERGDISYQNEVIMQLGELLDKQNLTDDFWIFLRIEEHGFGPAYFHERKTLSLSGNEHDQLYESLLNCMEEICMRVNQKMLLDDLYEKDLCRDILVPADDDDWTNMRAESSVPLYVNMPGSKLSSVARTEVEFEPGHFECHRVWETNIPIHYRLKSSPTQSGTASRAVMAARSILDSFAVSNRSNLFVCKETTGNVFYFRIREMSIQADQVSVHKATLDNDHAKDDGLSRTSSVQSLQSSACQTGTTSSSQLSDMHQDMLSKRTSSVASGDGSSVSDLSTAGVYTGTEDFIHFTVYGICHPGNETKVDLIQDLCRRLDEVTLKRLNLLLTRNPKSKLALPDVQFIQPPGKPPVYSLRFALPSLIHPLAHSMMYYLRQIMLVEFNTPRFIDASRDQFRDYGSETAHGTPAPPIPSNDVYLYVERCKEGVYIGCIHLSLVNHRGQSVFAPPVTPSPTYFENTTDHYTKLLLELLDCVQEVVPENEDDQASNADVFIQFNIWGRGDVGVGSLLASLRKNVKAAVGDVFIEHLLLTSSLCALPQSMLQAAAKLALGSSKFEPHMSMLHFKTISTPSLASQENLATGRRSHTGTPNSVRSMSPLTDVAFHFGKPDPMTAAEPKKPASKKLSLPMLLRPLPVVPMSPTAGGVCEDSIGSAPSQLGEEVDACKGEKTSRLTPQRCASVPDHRRHNSNPFPTKLDGHEGDLATVKKRNSSTLESPETCSTGDAIAETSRWQDIELRRRNEALLKMERYQYEAALKGNLNATYVDPVRECFKMALGLSSHSVHTHTGTLSTDYSAALVLRESVRILQDLFPEITPRVFMKVPRPCDVSDDMASSDHDFGYVTSPFQFVPYCLDREGMKVGDRRESSVDLRHVTSFIPLQSAHYVVVVRNVHQWRSCMGIHEEDLEDRQTSTIEEQFSRQKFTPYEITVSSGGHDAKRSGTGQQAPSCVQIAPIPRQKLLIMFFEGREVSLFSYNLSKPMLEAVDSRLLRLYSWHGLRAHINSVFMMQKAGLFHHMTVDSGLVSRKDEGLASFSSPKGHNHLMMLLKEAAPLSSERLAPLDDRVAALIPQVPIDHTFRDSSPHRELHKAPYRFVSDPVKRTGYQYNEVRNVKWNLTIQQARLEEVHKMWQQKGLQAISEDRLQLLRHHSRVIHFCEVKVLFDVVEPHASKGSADTPEKPSKSGGGDATKVASHEGQRSSDVRQEEERHRDLGTILLQEYCHYMELLGFHTVQVNTSIRRYNRVHPVKHMSKHPDFTPTDPFKRTKFLQKTRPGGIALFELTVRDGFFSVMVSSLETSRIKSIARNVRNEDANQFLEDCSKLRDLVCVQSFYYDFHLRHIHQFICGKQPALEPGFSVHVLLRRMLEEYAQSPADSWCTLTQGTVKLPNAYDLDACLIFKYMLANCRSYGLGTIVIKQPLHWGAWTTDRLLTVSSVTTKNPMTMSAETKRIDKQLVVEPLALDGELDVFALRYYLLLVNRKDAYLRPSLASKSSRFRKTRHRTASSSEGGSLTSVIDDQPPPGRLRVRFNSSTKTGSVDLHDVESFPSAPPASLTSRVVSLPGSFQAELPYTISSHNLLGSATGSDTILIAAHSSTPPGVDSRKLSAQSLSADTKPSDSSDSDSSSWTLMSRVERASSFGQLYDATATSDARFLSDETSSADKLMQDACVRAMCDCWRDSIWCRVLVSMQKDASKKKKKDKDGGPAIDIDLWKVDKSLFQQDFREKITHETIQRLSRAVACISLKKFDPCLHGTLSLCSVAQQTSVIRHLIAKFDLLCQSFPLPNADALSLLIVNPKNYDMMVVVAFDGPGEMDIDVIFREKPPFNMTTRKPSANWNHEEMICVEHLQNVLSCICLALWARLLPG